MRSVFLDLALVCAVGLLVLFVFDYADSMRLILPAYQLMKEYISFIVAGLAVVIGLGIIGGEPHLRSR